MKKAYILFTMQDLTASMEAFYSITKPAKKVTIFNALLNMNIAWNSVPEVVVQKCFK